MNCRDLQELLSAYADGELSQTQKESVEQHLSGCADCRATLASYRKVREELASLRAVPRVGDIKEATMSRIKAETVLSKPRRWLKPAMVGVSLAVAAAIVSTIMVTTSSQRPQDVLAQAVANTQNLKSFRVYDFAEYHQPGSADWVTTYYKEVDYGRIGLIHTLARFTLGSSNNSATWQRSEFIIDGTSVYLQGSTPPIPFKPESISQGWAEQAASLQQPADYLKLLADPKRMPDEEIDGVTCLYYRSLVNMDAWVKQQVADAKERARLRSSSWTEERAKQLEALWRTRQVELEFWIGKNDHTLHQWRQTDTHAPGAETDTLIDKQSAAMRDGRETIRYYDFNQNIVVEPPLDAQGNLLPDWRLQGAQP